MKFLDNTLFLDILNIIFFGYGLNIIDINFQIMRMMMGAIRIDVFD
jgi:hypothetical protein